MKASSIPLRPLRSLFDRITRGGDADARETVELDGRPPAWLIERYADLFDLPDDDIDWLARMQLAWVSRVPLPTGLRALRMCELLEARHVQNCVVLPSRYDLLSRLPEDSVCAEVGTAEGFFAAEIVHRCRPAELHLFDREFGPFFEKSGLVPSNSLIIHEGDSSTELAKLDDEAFDWIYIDGDHSYAGVAKDVEVAKAKVKRDGLLIFNDYTLWSPLELLPYGVPQVVNELCVREGWELLYFCMNALFYCDVAIRRIDTGAGEGS
jgi:hypothetical protein